MDVRMPGMEATRRIVATGGRFRVLVMTTFDLAEYAHTALRAGASGFLLKDAPRRTVGGRRRRCRRSPGPHPAPTSYLPGRLHGHKPQDNPGSSPSLNALWPAEGDEFTRHLAECPACDQEVRELRETASRLAFAVAPRLPLALRERVVRALSEVRQLPPLMAGNVVVPLRDRTWQRWLPHLAVAACRALVASAGGWAAEAQRETDHQRSRVVQAAQRVSDLQIVMAAPDATLRTGSMGGGGAATVVASQRLGRTVFVYHDLPALAASRVYQLWYSQNGTMIPAGLIAPGRTDGTQLLTGGPSGSDAVGVTVEPAGGSRTPSGPPAAVIPLE
ncbi:anti-sigma factor domain-containing protein [Streptomyces sp. H39-S7]|uniref:anti-sigma factor n=1 Tax=Streptomyces sp. H39-S7 TaxID=3004357 RepID=UPI0022AF8B5F|nr:anti-sigma factor [Streptomyces sp. H39-S7]MCZ4123802.1 anti-sigma factor [Streptomyces sp. H39-S7]